MCRVDLFLCVCLQCGHFVSEVVSPPANLLCFLRDWERAIRHRSKTGTESLRQCRSLAELKSWAARATRDCTSNGYLTTIICAVSLNTTRAVEGCVSTYRLMYTQLPGPPGHAEWHLHSPHDYRVPRLGERQIKRNAMIVHSPSRIECSWGCWSPGVHTLCLSTAYGIINTMLPVDCGKRASGLSWDLAT